MVLTAAPNLRSGSRVALNLGFSLYIPRGPFNKTRFFVVSPVPIYQDLEIGTFHEKISTAFPFSPPVYALPNEMQKFEKGDEKMKRNMFSSKPTRRALLVLVCAAALSVVACDNDVTFSPTAPTFPNLQNIGNVTTAGPGRSLEIRGSLTAKQGSCLEATILYDGRELEGARAVCREGPGCAKLELTADVLSTGGHHTISFQVLSQSSEVVDYVAEGSVLVSREGIPFLMTIDLEPTRATLRPGESVTFDVDFLNSTN